MASVSIATQATNGHPSGPTAGQQSAPLEAADIKDFGNGLLNLVKGYEYNEEQIMSFLHDVSTKRSDVVGTVAKGIQMFLLTANNEHTAALALGGHTIDRDKITKASIAQSKGPVSLTDVPSIPTKDSALLTVGKPLEGFEDGRLLPFPIKNGVDLPMIAIYDYLAWLLSVLGSEETSSAGRNAENYYLPLLALLSRWTTIISGTIKFIALPMVHISWWDKNVLLGSTLGDAPNVPSGPDEAYVKPRKIILGRLGFTAPKSSPEGIEAQNYGRCAETFFFIVAKTQKLEMASVKGFAMIPAPLSDLPMNKALKPISAHIAAQPSTPAEAAKAAERLQSLTGKRQKEEIIASEKLAGEANKASNTLKQTYAKLSQYETAGLRLNDPCKESCQHLFGTGQLGWAEWEASFSDQMWQAQFNTLAAMRKDWRAGPEKIGVGGVGEGSAKTANQMLANTGLALSQPLLTAAAPAVMSGLANVVAGKKSG